MSRQVLAQSLAALVVASWAAVSSAQTRTPWQMHDGLEVTAADPLGLVPFTCSPSVHGDICEYGVATVPPSTDPGWRSAPDPDVIGFSIPSRVCSAPVTCMAYGDFTYFQTFVNVPADAVVSVFTIAFSGMDDGSRVSIYNSAHPTGLVIPGSYVFLGGSGTTDLSTYVVAGEVNRVVITQVDDCCSANNLQVAQVVLNGKVIPPAADSTPPRCALTGVGVDASGRKYIQVTVQDTGSGLASIGVTTSTNASTPVPSFTTGTTSPVVVIGTKVNQSQASQIALHVTDVAGNVTDCDPLVAGEAPAPAAAGGCTPGPAGLVGVLGLLLAAGVRRRRR